MKIQNLTSPRSGRPVVNQFVAYNDSVTWFQSYESLICTIDGQKQKIIIGKHWDYSVTTAKYFNQFLREFAPVVNFTWNRKTIEKAMNDGTITDRFGRTWSIEYASWMA